MDNEECKKNLSEKGVNVDNLSEDVIKFLCGDQIFGGIGPNKEHTPKSLNPAERVNDEIQKLDSYVVNEQAKSSILDLISDVVEAFSNEKNSGEKTEETNSEPD